MIMLWKFSLKGEPQNQNKLISSKRPFEILQNETKIVKIRQTVLEIFNFKDLNLDSFREKPKIVFFRSFAKLSNNRFCDVTNYNCKIKQ